MVHVLVSFVLKSELLSFFSKYYYPLLRRNRRNLFFPSTLNTLALSSTTLMKVQESKKWKDDGALNPIDERGFI